MKIRAVLFDLDGTLTAFNIDYRAARREINKELEELGVGELGLREGVMISAMLSRLQAMLPEEAHRRLVDRVQRLIERYELESANATELQPYALETLQALRDNGLKIAIVTNNGYRAAKIAVERSGLFPLIDALVTREDAARWKPDGATIREALKRLEVKAKEVIFVGDSTIDVLAARDSGVVSVALPTGPTETTKLLTTGPDYVVSSLTEIASLIDRLRSGKD